MIRRCADAQPVGLPATASAGSRAFQIRQRLAHAHDDDWLSRSSGGQQPLQPQHLLDDFAGGQIARDAVQAAGAKDAAHARSRLAC